MSFVRIGWFFFQNWIWFLSDLVFLSDLDLVSFRFGLGFFQIGSVISFGLDISNVDWFRQTR